MNWLRKLSRGRRNALGAGVVLLVAVLVANLVYLPRQRQIGTLEADVAQINSELTIYQAKVRKLDTLLTENERLGRLLEEQRQQLPEEQEVANLLKQVTDLGTQAGLVFRLWRPGAAVPAESGMYQELPVQVEVTGSYHQVGLFFEQVAGLSRIVNISNVMISPDTGGGGMLAKFTATAFAAPPHPEGDGTADPKAKGNAAAKPGRKP
ncbi:MAG: type 4a pilus biogenesis protein PilO [Nitrospirae bacterium]|nr:type 4a pilus biogenesis protein PilO [Nitrospirota bacterium]